MRRALVVVLVLVAAAAGWFVYRNGSIERLRAEFRPWMLRLSYWRDACEAARRALRSRETTPADPAGIGPLRDWAWSGLDRVGYVDYRVEKPTHRTGGPVETTTGSVTFTVGGFRADGARVERSARVTVTDEGPPPPPAGTAPSGPRRGSIRFERAVAERVEPHPRFHDATRDAGLGAARTDPPFQMKNRLISDIWPGSGVAVLDYDRDGHEDLFVADGVRSILYRGDGHGRFEDVTARAGLVDANGKGVSATGVAAGDVDGDGYPDLLVTDAFGPARLLRNRRDGTFEDVTQASGIRVPGLARSAAFADVDGDGDLDLFVAVTGDYWRQMPDPAFDAKDGRRNFLYINDGHGHFTDATQAWGIAGETRWTLSTLFQDYDQDGREDILVTNDFGLKNLYRNEGGRFADVAKKAGAQVRAYGMSGAWADFDGDGRPDIYATGTDTQWYFLHEYPSVPVSLLGRIFLAKAIEWCEEMAHGNTLLLQRADHTFENATERSGARLAGWNWSSIAADLDDDGWPDVYSTNGMWGDGRDRDHELEFWWDSLAYWDDYVAGTRTFDRQGAGIAGIERDRYFHNRGGAAAGAPLFEDRAFLDGLDLESNGRAAVAFDANEDGALDIYVRSVQSPEALFLGSRRPEEHFLRLRLAGEPGLDNRDGIGARIEARLPGGRVIVTENANASGYLSTGSPIVHLGLGAATRVDALTVRWPSGKVQALGGIDAVDRTVTVDEARGVTPSGAPTK
ncbi:MAG TPA: CRTAC1 family protein [Thermoanaerobaculia bacterium]|nr:CRTAC1 family protein [Thermoanaerobaculia bacterium]